MFEWEPYIVTFKNSPGEEVIEKQIEEFWEDYIGPHAQYSCFIEDHFHTWQRSDGSEWTERTSHMTFYTDIPLNLQFFISFFDMYKYSYKDIDFCSHNRLSNS